MDVQQKIVLLLGEITQGRSNNEKLQFLYSIGYTNFKQIEELDEDDKIKLMNRLLVLSAPHTTYDLNGVVITRPENPTSVKEISFTLPK